MRNALLGTAGGWYDYASTSSVEPRPLTSIPVLIEHPDGCVEVALQPVAAKVEDEQAECPAGGREVEMAAVTSASARSPRRNRSGGLRSVADSSGGAAPFSDVDLERGLSIIASLATPRVIWARHAAYLESRRAAQIPFMTAVIGPDGVEYVSELGASEVASAAPAKDENQAAKEGVEVAELPEESPAPGPSRSSASRQSAPVGSENGRDAGG
ncbi:hypothetical protein H632_c878p0 [Helicosporidium sp. ATCC 50920]|nr:hypothetical protein H632_c878p0 [Helicosporidium sp. ATCC 50920]|eukprot:KDD75089.1 hypothetical protein H632_c878p0 [Helicosporidium sp. ATCC 50920]